MGVLTRGWLGFRSILMILFRENWLNAN